MIRDAAYVRGADVIFRDLQGEAVLLDLNTGLYFSMNPVAGFIWRLLDGDTTVRGIAERVAAEFEVDADVAAGDTEELIRDLLDQKLAFPAPAEDCAE